MPDPKAQLSAVRNHLLKLHKILLEIERQRYEKVNGRIDDMFQLLNLTINDPAFAWLRPLSALIVSIDEKMEDKDTPMTDESAKTLLREVRELVSPNQVGNDFQRNYHWSLQEYPDAVIAHGTTIKLLNS
jgi:hypothetical protein